MRGGWWRWVLLAGWVAAGLCAGVVAWWSRRGWDGFERALKLLPVWLAASAVAAGIAWARRRDGEPGVCTPHQVEAARRTLAALVLSQWRGEAETRQLDDPVPLAVRWRLTELNVLDHAVHIAGRDSLVPSSRSGRLRFDGCADRIGAVADQFRMLARRRLVIAGEAGMGKTTLAVLLLRELLDHPNAAIRCRCCCRCPGGIRIMSRCTIGWDGGSARTIRRYARVSSGRTHPLPLSHTGRCCRFWTVWTSYPIR
jgi:hypothetical protein